MSDKDTHVTMMKQNASEVLAVVEHFEPGEALEALGMAMIFILIEKYDAPLRTWVRAEIVEKIQSALLAKAEEANNFLPCLNCTCGHTVCFAHWPANQSDESMQGIVIDGMGRLLS